MHFKTIMRVINTIYVVNTSVCLSGTVKINESHRIFSHIQLLCAMGLSTFIGGEKQLSMLFGHYPLLCHYPSIISILSITVLYFPLFSITNLLHPFIFNFSPLPITDPPLDIYYTME